MPEPTVTVRMKEDGFAPGLAPCACLMPWGVFRQLFAGNVHMSSFHPLTHAISAKEVH